MKRYPDEQIALALRQAESGTVVKEIGRNGVLPIEPERRLAWRTGLR
jgi:hypothetical protein